MSKTHIRVSVDFTEWGGHTYDLAIPKQITVKQLLLELQRDLILPQHTCNRYVISLSLKKVTLMDDDRFSDFHIANGEILFVHD